MEKTPQSGGERHIERLMQDLDPASERYQVLDTAKRFKSSWVELGDRLHRVSGRSLYREWGYGSFEEYCVQEIRIRKQTAEKLTMAYRFLERQEPELLARQVELKPLPDYRSVDLLRQAREEKGFSDEEYAELRRSVVEEERSHPTVLKRFRETAARHEPAADSLVTVKAGLSAARRLDASLPGIPEVPADFPERLSLLIAHLEALVTSGE